MYSFSAILDIIKTAITGIFDIWARMNTALQTTSFVITFVVLCLLTRYIVISNLSAFHFGDKSDSVNHQKKEY